MYIWMSCCICGKAFILDGHLEEHLGERLDGIPPGGVWRYLVISGGSPA